MYTHGEARTAAYPRSRYVHATLTPLPCPLPYPFIYTPLSFYLSHTDSFAIRASCPPPLHVPRSPLLSPPPQLVTSYESRSRSQRTIYAQLHPNYCNGTTTVQLVHRVELSNCHGCNALVSFGSILSSRRLYESKLISWYSRLDIFPKYNSRSIIYRF